MTNTLLCFQVLTMILCNNVNFLWHNFMFMKSCFSPSSVDGPFDISSFNVAGNVHVCALACLSQGHLVSFLGSDHFFLLRENILLGLGLIGRACLAGHWSLEFCPFPSPQHQDFMWEWISGLFACTLSTLLINYLLSPFFPDFVTTELYWQAAWHMSIKRNPAY